MPVASITTNVMVSCSELGAAAGIDPYCSSVELWARKTGLIDPPPMNEAMHFGTLLEPIVRDEVERQGWQIMPGPHVIIDTDLPWLLGHPDGYVAIDGERGVYEGKTCSPWVRGWEDDGVPVAYIAQVHGYMRLADARACLVACLVAGQRLEIRVVRRDDTFLDLLLERVHDFLGYVERNEPPPPDGTAATDAVLKRLYPRSHPGVAVEFGPADMQMVGQWRALKEQRKEVERQEKECAQALQMRLGDAELGTHDGETVVRWQTVERKEYTVAASAYRRLS